MMMSPTTIQPLFNPARIMGYDQHIPIKPQETRLSMRLTRALHCNTKSNQGAIENLVAGIPTYKSEK